LEVSLDFCGDSVANLFSALRETKASELPQIKIIATYRNIMGGCFLCEKIDLLVPPPDIEELLRLWHTCIASFPVEAKEIVDKLRSMPRDDNWRDILDKSKELFESQLEVDDNIEIKCIDKVESFKLKAISQGEYDKLTSNQVYGKYIHKQAECKKHKVLN
jgi:hypothetical protein